MNNQEVSKLYPFGIKGMNLLSIQRSIYSQSEELPNNSTRVIECDIEEKWMKVREKRENEVDWIEMDESEIKKGDVLDLNENGVRWEGDSLNGIAFGYGCIYNEENQVIFSGFVFEGKKVCYGKDMFGDIGIVEYKGGYYNNTRFGYGSLYDKKNELIYEGEWYNNNPMNERRLDIHEELKEEDIHFGFEEIVIGENCLDNVSCFKLIGFNNLKKLVIHRNRLERMKMFCIENCNELVDVLLNGDDSIDNLDREELFQRHERAIRGIRGLLDNDNDENENLRRLRYEFVDSDNNDEQTLFRIANCNKIQNLEIKDKWCIRCHTVELNSTNTNYDIIQ